MNAVKRITRQQNKIINKQTNGKGEEMKALKEVIIVEVTLVLALPSYYDALSSIDYITVHEEAQVLGWSERELEIKPKEGQ